MRAFLLACVVTLGVGSLACGTPEDKANAHIERGRERLADGKVDAALIEFKNALRQNPKSVAANVELAKIALREKNTYDAIFYYREANQAAPDDQEVGIDLALLLLSIDPAGSRRLIDDVIARHPETPLPQAASSQIFQAMGEIHSGLRAARRAAKFGPEIPGMHWQLGTSCQAMIYLSRARRRSLPDSIYEEGLKAYDDFFATGGEEWKARIEQARLIAAWPGHEAEAIEAARRAMAATKQEDPATRALASRHLSWVAKAQGNREAFAEALEAFIELNPRDLIAWKSLAELVGVDGNRGGADGVYRRLLKRDPGDPDAHILYTAFIAQNLGVRAGLKYLDSKIEEGVDPSRLMAEKASLQRSVGLKAESALTRRQMKKKYPNDVWTILEVCRHGVEQGKFVATALALRNLAETDYFTDVFVLLAQVELSLGNLRAALAAAHEAVDVAGRFDPKADRILSITLVENQVFAEAVEVLQHLELRMGLLPSEEMLLARAYYGIGDDRAGRKILMRMLDNPTLRYSKEEVVLEYSRREMSHLDQRDRIRAELDKALRRSPHSRDVLVELVRLDLDMGRQAVALQRIADLKLGLMTPELVMLRARLKANTGDLEGAHSDAKWVFRRDPSQPDLLDLLLTLYTKLDIVETQNARLENRIKKLTAKKEKQPTSSGTKLAWHHLLRSRLLLTLGHEREAIRVLAAAILSGEWVKDTKLDYAFLLAKSGKQLDFALEVAQSAAIMGRPDPHAIDTVGYVLLKQGDYRLSQHHFLKAIKLAQPPRALFYYHLYIALSHLDRPDDALRAIRSVVTIDPAYPKAVAIRDRLQADLEAAKKGG